MEEENGKRIEKLKTYTDEQIDTMSIDELKGKFKQLQIIAKNGNNIINSLVKANNEEKYKLALFMLIRNNRILPAGKMLKKTDYEINKMTYLTMHELFKIIDFKKVKKMYEEGEKSE